jgi:DNA primase
VNRKALDELKQQMLLLDYLRAHDWQPARQPSRGRLMGLCPLHADHQPSFLVDPRKSLFYCYGCGRGGDVIRFAELCHQVKFPQALSLLHQWHGLPPLLREAAPSIACSCTVTARQSPIWIDVGSAHRN